MNFEWFDRQLTLTELILSLVSVFSLLYVGVGDVWIVEVWLFDDKVVENGMCQHRYSVSCCIEEVYRIAELLSMRDSSAFNGAQFCWRREWTMEQLQWFCSARGSIMHLRRYKLLDSTFSLVWAENFKVRELRNCVQETLLRRPCTTGGAVMSVCGY